MNETYRGHCICLTRTRMWDAVIVHAESGVTLPTKATALLREGRSVAVSRAMELVDLYLDAPREPGPLADTSTIPSVVMAGAAQYSVVARRASS